MIDRRRFLRSAAMTVAGARLGIFVTAEAYARESRELAAIGRATEWLNSSRLTAASLLGKVVVADFCTYTCINWLRTERRNTPRGSFSSACTHPSSPSNTTSITCDERCSS